MASPKNQTQARRQRLLELLADGWFHSGELIARRLHISRGGVWKLVNSLREAGIEIQSLPRQGYRLPRAVDLYDRKLLSEAIEPAARAALDRVEVLLSVDSTNRYLADSEIVPGRARVCVAEVQSAGRGRRGRTWLAPFGSGLCMSLAWQFAEAPPTFSAISLAVGVAAVRAFKKIGALDVGLKWPNDLIWKNRKLGGILIEMRGESAGPAHVVIGIGVNMHMPAAVRLTLAEQQAALIADVREMLREAAPTRNVLAGALVTELVAMLQTFAQQGFEPFIDEWRRLDTLAHAQVKVISGTETAFGTACGVDIDGMLLVEVDGQVRRLASGEVSLRAMRPAGSST